MKGEDGIENPAFESPTPDLGGRRRASPAGAGADAGSPQVEAAEEGPCGWGRCTPKALQLCNTPEGYLAAYSLLAIFQGIVVNGLINISISTIEKRYELNSSLTGLISASYDIAFCVLSLFVSFFGERGHKPRWLAFSAFMLGLGSLVFSLPHFSSGKYHYGAKFEDTCQISGTSSANFTCSASTKSSLSNYLYVFILGQLLLGVGGTPLYTLGTAFIDDSVPKHKSSLYIGLVLIPAAALGQVISGILVSKYKMDCKNIIKFMIGTCSVAFLLNTVFLVAKCGNKPFAGVSETYNGCVPDKQRSFALGVQSVFLRLLGTVPGPILFGVAIDNSCSLWDVDECKTKGACWVYDNERMAYLLMSISKVTSPNLTEYLFL
ncbi:UNVERIFIED_CONTAM: hypothetical protein H355_008159 [Colinus virginianus]|nr:hypothetical protein H355_008159 [Colinus virginianus]